MALVAVSVGPLITWVISICVPSDPSQQRAPQRQGQLVFAPTAPGTWEGLGKCVGQMKE